VMACWPRRVMGGRLWLRTGAARCCDCQPKRLVLEILVGKLLPEGEN